MINEELQCKIKRAEDEYESLKDTIHDLYDENKKLKERIDKAIEYIENTKFDLSNDEYDLREYDGIKLLNILKGEDKE